MRYSPDEIASYAIEGGQIAVFAALGLVLTAIMLGSACHILRSAWSHPVGHGGTRRPGVRGAVLVAGRS
jgi:hypothetical protein